MCTCPSSPRPLQSVLIQASVFPINPPVIEEVIKMLNAQMKQFHDEALRCKVFYIMEACLHDHRLEPEDIVADTLLVAVHHCLNPPTVREHKTWVKKCSSLVGFFDMIEFSSCTEFYHTLLQLVTPPPPLSCRNALV